jgi:hypothetical protein
VNFPLLYRQAYYFQVANAGGLMGYGTSFIDAYHQAGRLHRPNTQGGQAR